MCARWSTWWCPTFLWGSAHFFPLFFSLHNPNLSSSLIIFSHISYFFFFILFCFFHCWCALWRTYMSLMFCSFWYKIEFYIQILKYNKNIFLDSSHCVISIILPSHKLSFSSAVESLYEFKIFADTLSNCRTSIWFFLMNSVSLLTFLVNFVLICSSVFTSMVLQLCEQIDPGCVEDFEESDIWVLFKQFQSPAFLLFIDHMSLFFACFVFFVVDWMFQITFIL